MSDPFIGEIRPVGFSFAPVKWAFCDGQTLPIDQNQALYALFGTTYGGNGVSTVGLPDLRGRCVVGAGSQAGVLSKPLGTKGGYERVALTESQIPYHTHGVEAYGGDTASNTIDPTGALPASSSREAVYTQENPTVAMAPASVSASGGGVAHENMMPFQVINYIVALDGLFPTRS